MTTPEWLRNSLLNSPDGSASFGFLAWKIALAFALGGVVAGMYRWAKRGEAYPATFLTTLILLSTLIAMATQIIGDNIARAFSLVGALSVVRFRTVVKDTQDTAFVIFAVVLGMAAGANHLAVAVVGVVLMGIASLILWPARRGNGWRTGTSVLTLRVEPAEGVQAAVDALLALAAARVELTGIANARKGAALDLAYRLRFRGDTSPTRLVADLGRIEGVANAELRRE